MVVSGYDGDVVMNVARILSKMTLQAECCMEVCSNKLFVTSFLEVFKRFVDNEDIIVRIAFTMGNMFSKHDHSRLHFIQLDAGLETLLNLLSHYVRVLLLSGSQLGLEKRSKVEDVLIKVLRLTANMTLNEDVGYVMVQSHKFIKLLSALLDYEMLQQNEELINNLMSLLINLSYYNNNNDNINNKNNINNNINNNSNNNNNIKRPNYKTSNINNQNKHADTLTKDSVNIDLMIASYLDSDDNEVVFSSCGTLINFMIDPKNRRRFRNLAGVEKIIGVIETFSQNDWQLVGMACQILSNYSLTDDYDNDNADDDDEDGGHGDDREDGKKRFFTKSEIHKLMTLLQTFLGL
ncbi:hypothetical protein HELRODRAFT_86638 [Helobdella robusta]|uniref:Armadillo repeat-containing domain-containing protein n=1 Tax=Helobdella robusta TaxID=6412 RepID=T1G6E8_HELRO|nr:hypothetical protein HELRODRAFT_86638 [Helobdella robusta]ESN95482.1 hypothetical protein HELRODRAFT_86638 [Helobdella robusta]